MGKMKKKLKEGRIMIYDCHIAGDSISIIAKLMCETDFLAKGKIFIEALTRICKIIATEEGDIDTVVDSLSKESKEKIEFMHTIWKNNDGGDLPSNYYLHHDSKKVAFVQLRVDKHHEEAKKLARDVAMHVVAFSPSHVSEEDVGFNWEDINLEISEELLKNKPQKIIDKIMLGKKSKYRRENMLLDQLFVKNLDKTVAEEIAEFNGTYNTDVKVLGILQMVI
jgi:elongation factor Ts